MTDIFLTNLMQIKTN